MKTFYHLRLSPSVDILRIKTASIITMIPRINTRTQAGIDRKLFFAKSCLRYK